IIRTIDTVRREALVLLHGLVIEVFPVDHEEDFINKVQFRSQTLLVMRPYQIAATERILWKINSSFKAKNWSKPESGGFIWH
ncbi:hypothetical protein CWN05_30455, partial [Klebsiella pneumoniae]